MKSTLVHAAQPATRVHRCALAFAFVAACATAATAQTPDFHSHASMSAQRETEKAEHSAADTLVEVVKAATERFKDVSVATAEGYSLVFGCVTGPDSGAMGLHYLNQDILKSGVLDPTRPTIVIYEPLPGGGRKLIGADFLVFAEAWDKTHSSPPELMGQWFHYFESPNRFGLPAFYTLHVWAWKQNPNGAFVNWHPNVNCKSFADQ